MMVTGYDEAVEIFNDPGRFSSCISTTGPFPGFPVPLEGADVTGLIEQHRDELPFNDQLPTFDPPHHTAHRGLLMRLITPKRLRESEASMEGIADRQLDTFLVAGECEYIGDFAAPFTMIVIADLLGVPDEDMADFKKALLRQRRRRRQHGGTHGRARAARMALRPVPPYIEDRRREPRGDVLTGLATATFPDGSSPRSSTPSASAVNLFAAGQGDHRPSPRHRTDDHR